MALPRTRSLYQVRRCLTDERHKGPVALAGQGIAGSGSRVAIAESA